MAFSPVYPEEEAEDENVVEDNQDAELDLEKPDENAILVIGAMK